MKKLILLGIILFCPFALAQKKENTSSSGGRFQLIQLSDFRRDQYLLDTQTGKLWSKICMLTKKDSTDCVVSGWQEEIVEGVSHSKKDFGKMVDALGK